MGVEQIVMKFAQYSQSICSFDQGFLLKLDAAHAGSKGICYALSSCFILGCLSGKIPEDSFKIISDYNKLDTLVAIQKAYSDFNEDRAGISEEERDKINVEHTFHELMGRTGWFSCPGFTVEPVMKLSNHVGAPASIVGKLVSGAGTPPSALDVYKRQPLCLRRHRHRSPRGNRRMPPFPPSPITSCAQSRTAPPLGW